MINPMYRSTLARAIAVVVLSSMASPAYAAPGTTVSAPIPCASPSPLASGGPFLAAFAYEIKSTSILRFVAALAVVARKAQEPLFEAGLAATATPAEQKAVADIAALCPGGDAIEGSIRAENLVANTWSADVVSDDARVDRFATAVSAAIGALALGDRLPAEDRRVALAPFAEVVGEIASAPAHSAPVADTCPRDADAKTLVTSEPVYPPLAGMSGTSGTVYVKVKLTEDGYVQSASVFKDTLPDRAGADQIVISAIYAAVATTYASAIVNCKPIASSVLFTVDYERK